MCIVTNPPLLPNTAIFWEAGCGLDYWLNPIKSYTSVIETYWNVPNLTFWWWIHIHNYPFTMWVKLDIITHTRYFNLNFVLSITPSNSGAIMAWLEHILQSCTASQPRLYCAIWGPRNNKINFVCLSAGPIEASKNVFAPNVPNIIWGSPWPKLANCALWGGGQNCPFLG